MTKPMAERGDRIAALVEAEIEKSLNWIRDQSFAVDVRERHKTNRDVIDIVVQHNTAMHALLFVRRALKAALLNAEDARQQPVDSFQFGNPDDESLPLTRCVCGATYKPWGLTLSVYEDNATIMPCCGRRLYFTQSVEVREVSR